MFLKGKLIFMLMIKSNSMCDNLSILNQMVHYVKNPYDEPIVMVSTLAPFQEVIRLKPLISSQKIKIEPLMKDSLRGYSNYKFL